MHDTLALVLTLLATAVGMVMVFRRLRLPPLLAYLVAGVLLSLLKAFDLFAFAGGDAQNKAAMQGLAEFGVVFLMFSIGLEFSLPKLSAMRREVFVVGSVQVGLSVVGCVLCAIGVNQWAQQGLPTPALLEGLDWRSGVVLGGALAMSSTAIVVKALTEQLSLDSAHGRSVVGVLLFQDLAVVLFLILVPAIAAPNGTVLATQHSAVEGLAYGFAAYPWVWAVVLAVLKAASILSLLLYFGPNWMHRIFDLIARQQSRELFTLAVLLITLGLAWLTDWFGLSLALGAFVAGMLIAETPYRHAVEEDIKPFRDVLLGLFFLTLGMQLDLDVLLRQPVWVALCFIAPMLLKGGLVYAVVAHRSLGCATTGTALRSALALCAAGEFGFVLLTIANKNAAVPLVSTELSHVLLAAMVLSMMASPLLIQHAEAIVTVLNSALLKVFAPRTAADAWLSQAMHIHSQAAKRVSLKDHVIVLGYGRSGQSVAQLLRQEGVAVLALDLDPDRVAEARAAGQRVLYGDAARRDTLGTLGLTEARALVISFANTAMQLKVLHDVRAMAPLLPVVVRSQDETHMASLHAAGANDVVPERVEGSLMLASHALLRLGVPMRRVLHAVQQARGDGYQGLMSYFHGADDTDHGEAQLHTVVLSATAWAVSQTVGYCKQALHPLQVTVKTVRSSLGDTLGDDEQAEADSAWLLQGTKAHLDTAESLLLGGKVNPSSIPRNEHA